MSEASVIGLLHPGEMGSAALLKRTPREGG